MTTNKKAFTMRMQANNYEKLRTLARKNKRSMAMELEYIIEQYFSNYEAQNGEIPVEGDRAQINNRQIGNNNFFINGSDNQNLVTS